MTQEGAWLGRCAKREVFHCGCDFVQTVGGAILAERTWCGVREIRITGPGTAAADSCSTWVLRTLAQGRLSLTTPKLKNVWGPRALEKESHSFEDFLDTTLVWRV